MKQDILIQKLRDAIPGLIAVYQFGSQVTGKMHKESDFDLAVLASAPIPPMKRFDLAQDLAMVAKCDVDVVDLRQASTVMRMQVISTGTCLFSANDLERETFETMVYSAYARLNEERREILKDIAQRGEVHAR